MQIDFILNTFISGPQAWFFLADDRGYFADEGLTITFHEGDTLANAVPRLARDAFDAGYGDMNALIETAGAPGAPVAVYAVHNRPPYTIAVARDGAMKGPTDLTGRRLVTHPNDAAWRLFPEFCRATGLEADSVTIEVSELPHRDLVPRLLAGEWDGMFGFVNTIAAQSIEAGLDPAAVLRHFEWLDHVPPLYGGALMVSDRFRRDHPDAVAGLVRAVNRGVRDVLSDPQAGVEAVVRRNPQIDRAANEARLLGTIALEMGHAETDRLGLGDVDDDRISAAIALITACKSLPAAPVGRIFDRGFLPPLDQRLKPAPVPAG
ncbi:ABC transporter substrate-binding protein [Pseudooceanicola algae]|uniref:SsuA/THI5-like domain-containing protein n=1 Tax=Pseudooceanicola algae TaxID=1537215 RepID=A0A418SB27_9RHOB|nr:ABC transporter substrate-binding protein [Pseudooceanicola algae]QPM91326.1 hypothetical protein PSAL_025790 [Pseudooceanicola algae]